MRLADCYRLLDLQPGASPEEVKRAHRDLNKVWHPDRFGDDLALRAKAEEKLKSINAAYASIRESCDEAWPEAEGGRDEPGAWRARSRGRESRFADLESIARFVERGSLGEDADVFDPSTGRWAPIETIPRLRTALALVRSRRNRGWAFTCAILAIFLLARRPTPAGLLIAVALGVASYFLARRARADH
ncbi:MAG: DnaJ domain-containing protein [Thermoanaerobaculia bacterium]|nr:DnaJ domain-containing protein [Thermoanaerobaculia bacterium]